MIKLRDKFRIGDKILCIKNTDNSVANVRKGMTGIIISTNEIGIFNSGNQDRLCIKINNIDDLGRRYYLLREDDNDC